MALSRRSTSVDSGRALLLRAPDTLPVNILLEGIVFRATVTKPFPSVGGALEVGGR